MSGPDRMSCAEAIGLGKRWAERGVPAFPVAISWDTKKQATDKRPLTEHGHIDATTDSAQLERLFNARSPRPGEVWGIGLWPGPAGYAVVDVDIKGGAGGDDTWAALRAEHGNVDTYTVTTASGGGQLWGGKGDLYVGNAHTLGPGIDVRGNDGWVVAPGTPTPWGSWDREASSPAWPPTPWPRWVLNRLDATNGSGGGRGKWSKLDRSALGRADLVCLEALEALGGHDPYIGGDGAVMIVRPGKIAGGSASIGHVAPGVAKMFSSNWEIPGTNVKLVGEARYEADVLQRIVDNRRDPHLVASLVDPLTFKNGNQSNRETPQATLRLVRASTIRLDRPRWVWDRRIPVGGTTLMAGREGMGKTALVCWLAGRVTGGELPGEWEGRPADLVYIGHEDDRATVLNPRLVAAGADLDRVHFFDAGDVTFSVAEHVDQLTDRCRNLPVALVVVDPLDAHLGVSIDTNRDKARVQATIGNLARLAQELRCGALGLGHLNKAAITDLLAKVIGSVGFTTSVRSVLAIGEHPDDQQERVCLVAKANMTDRSSVPAVRFRVEGTLIDHPDDPFGIDTGRVVILGEQLGLDPNSLLVGDSEERSKIDEATDWLNSMLSDGPVLKSEILKHARAEGITKATLERAFKRIGAASERDDTQQGRPATWSLKGYASRVTPQDGVRHKPQAADQGEQPETGGYASSSDIEAKPPYETGTCSICGYPMTIIDPGQTAHPACIDTGGGW